MADSAFVCQDCGASFKRQANLRLHMKKHTGEVETFTCERCPGTVFGRIYELKRHNVVTHGEPGATPSIQKHVCEACGTEFRRGDALKRHRRRSEIVPCTRKRGAGRRRREASDDGDEDAIGEDVPDIRGPGELSALLAAASNPASGSGSSVGSPYEPAQQNPWAVDVGHFPDPEGGHYAFDPLTPATLEMLGYITHDQALVAGVPEDARASFSLRASIPFIAMPLAPEPEQDERPQVPFPVLVKALLPEPVIPEPVEPLTSLYPTVPAAMLPPWPVMSYLITQYFEFDHVRVPSMHPPTFYDDVATGRADPNVLLGVLLSGSRMADTEIGRRRSRSAGGGWDDVFDHDGAWFAALKAECLNRVRTEQRAIRERPPPELDPRSPDPTLLKRLTDLSTFAQLCRHSFTVMGAVADAVAITELWTELFGRLRFGELPGDDNPPSPDDLPAFIRREVRVRHCAAMLLGDAALADALGILPVLVDAQAPVEDASGRYDVPWANVRLSSGPNVLFESLPPASTPRHVWRGILRAEKTVELAEPPYELETSLARVLAGCRWPRLGDAHALHALALGDPRRTAAARTLGRGALRNGYAWLQMALTPLWAKFVRCKAFFVQRGWRLHAPPSGPGGEQAEGRKMREELVSGIGEWFRELHPAIGRLVGATDGAGLRAIAEREWGRPWRTTLPNAVVIAYTHLLILNSPSDIFDRVIVDESWPYSPQFVEAEALAMTVSRICKSSLRVEPDDGPGRPGESQAVKEARFRRRREDEIKRISPVWGLVALRACWVHVVAIRKFRALLHRHAGDPELIQLALETVRSLIEDVDGVLEGLGETGTSFKLIHSAYNVVRDLVQRDIMSLVDPSQSDSSPEAVWIGPSPEEMKRLRGDLEPGSAFAT